MVGSCPELLIKRVIQLFGISAVSETGTEIGPLGVRIPEQLAAVLGSRVPGPRMPRVLIVAAGLPQFGSPTQRAQYPLIKEYGLNYIQASYSDLRNFLRGIGLSG